MEINELRSEINEIDRKIVKLLEKRFDFVLQVGHYKKEKNLPIFDPERENMIIENCGSYLENKIYLKYLEQIYTEIMNSCKDIQSDDM